MKIDDKKIIVFGLGVTGKSVIKALSDLGVQVYIYDDREYEELRNDVYEISEYNFEIIHEDVDIDWEEIDYVVKSPGIRLDNDFIKIASENNCSVISEIELAYLIYGGENFISITGTNGKTTTTALLGHILKKAGFKSRAAGNIGVGLLYDMAQHGLDYLYVLELSSFQLASIEKFRSKYSIITNISPDHIDWHGSYDHYLQSKLNILKNTKKEDIVVVNKDDPYLSKIEGDNIKYFSIYKKTNAYYENGYLKCGDFSINKSELKIKGKHNIANSLAAIQIAKELEVDNETLYEALKTFDSIEHRLEYVTTIDGVDYYNDSKGTNTDSTRVAIESFDNKIVLIAGGYDKKVDFTDLFNEPEKFRAGIFIGETSKKLCETAKSKGLKNIKSAIDLVDAVNIAKNLAQEGDSVLFSPASASWDMYKNYEERGNHFKEIVKRYEKKK